MIQMFHGAGITPGFTNQDRTENIFSVVRGSNGQNEMPNILEYGKLNYTL